MKNSENDLRVLVIGAGPIVIGQAAEFDYSGTQACKVLREMGAYTVLINSNPATIQTDFDTADKVFIRTINWENAEKIIVEEKINAIIGCMAGQTGLNTLLELDERGILDRYSVRVLGTQPQYIRMAEDRIMFHNLMRLNGIRVPESMNIEAGSWKQKLDDIDFYPFMARTSFTLGGKSGAIIRNRQDAENLFSRVFSEGRQEEMEIEHALGGLVEMEYEVIRDFSGNSIMICNMENIDPMGVHTGESIVVTPSLTIHDSLHQRMRREALKIADLLRIEGACNVQFAIDQENDEIYTVEVNPRTSRSSALASKATGYPIAKIATELITGKTLTEIINPITGNTSASFEPSQDYVVVKIPLWPEKQFPEDQDIGVSMKSTGETMGIGRTFEESFFKAVVSTELDLSIYFRRKLPAEYIEKHIRAPSRVRLGCIINAIKSGYTCENISEMSGWDDRILRRIYEPLRRIFSMNRDEILEDLRELKITGIPDRIISWCSGISEQELIEKRKAMCISTTYRIIDSSSGEYRSGTRYLYSTYGEEDESGGPMEDSVIIMGSGPNRIAQGLEFDYSSVKAVRYLMKIGKKPLMINSNPETVSTDFDESAQLFFDPLVPEYVSGLIDMKKPEGIIVQFSGQTGQNMAGILSEIHGKEVILGTSYESILNIEDRNLFSKFLQENKILQPEWTVAKDFSNVLEKVKELGLPVIIRSSFIIGGSLMRILRRDDEVDEYISELKKSGSGNELHISRFMEGAREFDLDFLCSSGEIQVVGMMEHLEKAGVHSGDAISIGGEWIPEDYIRDEAIRIARLLSSGFYLKGFANLQFMEKDGKIYVIELNSRASRTLPIMSKHSGIPWIEYGTEIILGGKIKDIRNDSHGFYAKIPVFPFDRYHNSNASLGPEMKSTGEAMVSGMTLDELRKNIIDEMGLTDQFIVFTRENASMIHDGEIKTMSRDEAEKILDHPQDKTVFCSNGVTDSGIRKKCVARDIPFITDDRVFSFLYPERLEILRNMDFPLQN